jgi:hypothetical protein
MLLQNIVGQPAAGANNALLNGRSGQLGDMIVSELHGRYYETNYRQNVFTLSLVTAAAITAYTGAAAGTPMLAVFNPSGSTKNLAILKASFANVVSASAAGTVAFGLYFGTTTTITQPTTSAPFNMATLQQSGSFATGFRNVALTSGSGASSVIPLGSYYFGTAVGSAVVSSGPVFLEGAVIIPPGAYMALGGSSALTSATWIGSLTWEEIPV